MKSHNIRLITEALIIDKATGRVKRRYEQAPDNGEATLKLTHMDVNGNIKQVIEQPSKSFVSNFARMLNYGFMGVDNSSGGSAIDQILDTTGAALAAATWFGDVQEAAKVSPAQSTFGIWIGDKDNTNGWGLTLDTNIQSTESFEDYTLRGLILADGGVPDTGVEYRGTVVSYSGLDEIKITRRFQNDGASTIVVSEMGVVLDDGAAQYMIARDLILGGSAAPYQPISVLAGDILVAEYSYAISNASGFTRNYLKILRSLLVAGPTATYLMLDVNGNSVSVDFSTARTQLQLDAIAAADTYGIVISGNYQGGSPVVPSSLTTKHTMDNAKWAHSAGFTYSAMAPIALTQVTGVGTGTSYTQFGVTRDFENVGLQGPLEVYETALYLKEAAANGIFMITKSGFSPYPVVASGEILRINKYFRFMLQNTTLEWTS